MNTDTKYQIKRSSVSDQIFEIMKDRIISNEWKSGEKILSENELAKQFGVSRLSARTAVQRLAALGLVEIHVGDGTYVAENPLNNFINNGSALLATIRTKDDMGDFRQLFEAGYMTLACRARTDADIEKASGYLAQMEKAAMEGSFDNYIKYDIEFHKTLCESSRNQYFILIYRLLEESIIEHYKINTIACSKLPSTSENKDDDNYYLKELAEGHKNYIRALQERDASISSKYLIPYLTAYKRDRHESEQ